MSWPHIGWAFTGFPGPLWAQPLWRSLGSYGPGPYGRLRGQGAWALKGPLGPDGYLGSDDPPRALNSFLVTLYAYHNYFFTETMIPEHHFPLINALL